MIAAALVTLKQHRFEIAFGALAAIAVAGWALLTEFRLTSLGVPARCIDDWLITGPVGREDCAGAMREWGSILYTGEGIFNGQGPFPLAAMPLLPFLAGLLGGVPLVARELEVRTAQTAWSLFPSRAMWLLRQIAPVALVLGLSVVFAAFAASPVAAEREAWGWSASLDLGLHGPLVLTRAFAAFGIGLFAGALVGRALPAFVLGGLLCFTLLTASGLAEDAWRAGLTPVVIGEAPPAGGEMVVAPRSITNGYEWRTPEGQQISFQQARRIATAGGVPLPKADDPQDIAAAAWLDAHGYRLMIVGITDEMALGWGPYEAAIFGALGLISLRTAFWLVQRRRPK
jgi:hypothetical protein